MVNNDASLTSTLVTPLSDNMGEFVLLQISVRRLDVIVSLLVLHECADLNTYNKMVELISGPYAHLV